MSYTQRQLFGGAITCELPTDWRDVSNVRQVPDHQEVFQGMSNDPNMPGPSMIVELMEYQEDCGDDSAAAYFFGDLAHANGVTDPDHIKFTPQDISVSFVLQDEDSACEGGVGLQKISPGRDVDVGGNVRTRNPQWVKIEMCVLRLADLHTDLLITLSQPAGPSQENEPLTFSRTFLHAVDTLQIRDWGLFGAVTIEPGDIM